MRLIERATHWFGDSSVAVDIATRYPLTSEDWAAASVLRKLNLAGEVLAEHHEHGGLCAGCLVHCLESSCAGCVWHRPYPCPLAAIAQATVTVPSGSTPARSERPDGHPMIGGECDVAAAQ
jgi:hypothetical protein